MKHSAGFTLIETIMYAGLLAFVLGGAVVATFQMIEARQRAEAIGEIADEGNFVMRKIEWALSGAESIGSPAPGATSTALSVTKAGFGGNPIVIRQSGSDAVISYAGGSEVPLNDANTSFSTVRFERLPGDNFGIRVTLGIEYRPALEQPIYRATTTLETVIYARKK